MFSQSVLDKIKNSAIEYAAIKHQKSAVSFSFLERISSLTGYSCAEFELKKREPLDALLAIVFSSIRSEKNKAQQKSHRYNYNRHLALHHLYNDLQKKREKLITPRALK